MRVIELAKDLGVSSEMLLSLLRTLRISVPSPEAPVSDGDVSLILARLERERRAGRKDSAEAIEAVIEDNKPTAGRRRRRQRAATPEPEVEVPDSEEATVDGVEAVAEAVVAVEEDLEEEALEETVAEVDAEVTESTDDVPEQAAA